MFLGGQPKNIQCLAQYVYSEKTQNAYYKTNLNYVHFDNDISPFHFSGFEPVPAAGYYAPLNQVSFELQWIDENGKHQSTAGTKALGITDKEGNPIQPGEGVEHYALACAYNPTWQNKTEPVISAVTFDEAEVFLTGNPAECILSGLFNEDDYGGISSQTQKRLIYLNQLNARGVEYYDTCPDFRTNEIPDSDISSSCLSSIQEKNIELEVDEGQEAQSMKLWSLWGFDDFENAKDWPAQSEISGWDVVARHIHEVDGKNVGEIQYISLSAISGGDGAPGDADTPPAGLSSIQTRTLTGGEKVLQLYKFDDEEYVEDDIGDNLSGYDMVLRNREDNCVAYGSLSAIGGEVDLSGTDGSHKKGSAFKFKSADDSNIIVNIDNNGVITVGCYYL